MRIDGPILFWVGCGTYLEDEKKVAWFFSRKKNIYYFVWNLFLSLLWQTFEMRENILNIIMLYSSQLINEFTANVRLFSIQFTCFPLLNLLTFSLGPMFKMKILLKICQPLNKWYFIHWPNVKQNTYTTTEYCLNETYTILNQLVFFMVFALYQVNPYLEIIKQN